MANLRSINDQEKVEIGAQSDENSDGGVLIARNYPFRIAKVFCPHLMVSNDDLILLKGLARSDFESCLQMDRELRD